MFTHYHQQPAYVDSAAQQEQSGKSALIGLWLNSEVVLWPVLTGHLIPGRSAVPLLREKKRKRKLRKLSHGANHSPNRMTLVSWSVTGTDNRELRWSWNASFWVFPTSPVYAIERWRVLWLCRRQQLVPSSQPACGFSLWSASKGGKKPEPEIRKMTFRVKRLDLKLVCVSAVSCSVWSSIILDNCFVMTKIDDNFCSCLPQQTCN